MKRYLKEKVEAALPFLIYWFYRLYFATLRKSISPPDLQQPVIYAHYHGQEFCLVGAFARKGIAIMASRNKDGRLLANILHRFGYRTVAGSSSRGGAQALTELIHRAKSEQFSCALAVDGPRGPVYQVKPGALLLAKNTGFPLVPAVAKVSSFWSIRSTWDQTQLPKPFSHISMCYGTPIYIKEDATKEDLEVARLEVERVLAELYAQTH
jgi:lysophospholipid acyltransferase (LPLAT)-like uncharacterized protein